jgi:hypothetical protein
MCLSNLVVCDEKKEEDDSVVKWRVVLFVLLWKRLTPICNVNLSVVGETVVREPVPQKWKGARQRALLLHLLHLLLRSSAPFTPLASRTHMYVILCRIRKLIRARHGMLWTPYSKR